MRKGRSRSSFRARRKRSSAFGRRFISKSTSHLFALVDFQRIQLKPFFARLVISCMLFVFVGQGDYGVGSLWSQSRPSRLTLETAKTCWPSVPRTARET